MKEDLPPDPAVDRLHRDACEGCAESRLLMSRRAMAPVAARTPSAMGRSNDDPPFRTSAGARFTVTRW